MESLAVTTMFSIILACDFYVAATLVKGFFILINDYKHMGDS